MLQEQIGADGSGCASVEAAAARLDPCALGRDRRGMAPIAPSPDLHGYSFVASMGKRTGGDASHKVAGSCSNLRLPGFAISKT